MSRYAALAGRIRTGLMDVTNAVERAIFLADKATKTGDDGYWDGVALNLHGYYTGVEHIFEDVARTMAYTHFSSQSALIWGRLSRC